jgi:hypothetical protein
VPWAYEDSYFIYRGNKNGVVNLTDNLVLAKVDGHYLTTGTFTTEVLTLPPDCLFDRISFESRTPRGTAIRLAILDTADTMLLDNVKTNTELNLAQPVRLEFQFSTTNSSQTAALDAYRLTFRRNERRNKETKK